MPLVGWHYRPTAGLFGDPKPIHWRGWTHVFFQNSPGDGAFDGMRWAHVASRDLIRWERLPDALVPEPAGPDAFGCWTGSVVRVDDHFELFYTGVGEPDGRRQSVCRATSEDLVHWRRDPANPLLLPGAPFATGPEAAWRDPQLVRAGDGYRLLLTADLAGAPTALRGAVAQFRSTDLRTWDPMGVLYYPGDVHRCECPDLFEEGGRTTLLYSDFGVQVRWRDGEGRFRRDDPAQLDDFRFYAAKTARHEDGRRLLFAFLFGRKAETGPTGDSSPWEWGGVMALPRVVETSTDGRMRQRPAPELKRLRREQLRLTPEALPGRGAWRSDGDVAVLSTAHAVLGPPADRADLRYRLLGPLPAQAELDLEVAVRPGGDDRPYGVLLGCDRDLSVGYVLEIDPVQRMVALRRLMPEHNPSELGLQRVAVPEDVLAGGSENRLHIRLFLDHTVLEAFVNERVSLSARLYQRAGGPDRWWGVVTQNPRLSLTRLRGWRLARPEPHQPADGRNGGEGRAASG